MKKYRKLSKKDKIGYYEIYQEEGLDYLIRNYVEDFEGTEFEKDIKAFLELRSKVQDMLDSFEDLYHARK